MTAPYEHVVSVSGGVDSGATLLLAIERGRPFKAVFADTGNEHEAVYEHIAYLQEKTGVKIQTVRADFAHRIHAKRAYVEKHWPLKGVPQILVDRAVACLQPTGNPFLDLCLWKTRFPGAKTRFCTDELKIGPMYEHVQKPVLEAGRVLISWQGVRADESLARSLLPKWQRLSLPYSLPKKVRDKAEVDGWVMYAYRPLLDWKKGACFAVYKRHGLKWIKLYDLGFGRVGCMTCIMATKDEVRLASIHCPEHIERIAEWERLVSDVAKRGCATFFCTSDDPTREDDDEIVTLARYGIHAKVAWSKTTRGGRQMDFERMMHVERDLNTPCNTWGFCEA